MEQLIRTKADLKEWLKTDYEAYGFKYPILGKISYGENAHLFGYMRTLRNLEYYLNKRKRP